MPLKSNIIEQKAAVLFLFLFFASSVSGQGIKRIDGTTVSTDSLHKKIEHFYESIFRELLATAIGDRFTPWRWKNYIPYNLKQGNLIPYVCPAITCKCIFRILN